MFFIFKMFYKILEFKHHQDTTIKWRLKVIFEKQAISSCISQVYMYKRMGLIPSAIVMLCLHLLQISYISFKKGVWPFIKVMAVSLESKKQRKLYGIFFKIIK